MSASLKPTTFTTSRLLEFCSATELIAQTGHHVGEWPIVIVKELIDNALDACEEAGTAPTIRVAIARGCIRVADNGPGIPAETVQKILDFSSRTSSREAYVTPSRGRQGNALKTVVAMPFAMDGERGEVEIRSRGIRQDVVFRVDQLRQEPVIEHAETETVKTGTAVTVRWPEQSRLNLEDSGDEILLIARDAAAFNPHADIVVTVDCGRHRRRYRFLRSDASWAKWAPSTPTSPHWYDAGRLERLIGAYVKHDADHGRASRTVRDFLAEFAGLSGTVKRREVLAETSMTRTALADLIEGGEFDKGAISLLLHEMRAATKPMRPEKLGPVGKTHIEEMFARLGYDPGTFQYKQIKGIEGGVPWIVEAAFAWLPGGERRHLIGGVNWSPLIDSDTLARAIGSYVLGAQYCGPTEPVVLFLHLICPRVEFLDRGKAALSHHARGVPELRDAVEAVTKAWAKQRKSEERDRGRERRRRDALHRAAGRKLSIRDAAWQVIPQAYAVASSKGAHPTAPRMIYYQARPKILELTGKDELDDGYFSYTLLPEFMQENPELTAGWRVHFKALGHLTEPHTGRKVPLGTAEVADYRQRWTNGVIGDATVTLPSWAAETTGPHNRYSALAVVEKEGIADLLLADGVGERFDVAIVGNVGHSVEAELRLADQLQLPVFVLHDFDRTGLTIGANLRDGTWRHRYANEFPVIDVGLRLDQTEGLEREPISKKNLKSVSDTRLRQCGASEDEIAFLRRERVELNALPTGRLVEILEKAMVEHGSRRWSRVRPI